MPHDPPRHPAWKEMTPDQKFDFLHEWCENISLAVRGLGRYRTIAFTLASQAAEAAMRDEWMLLFMGSRRFNKLFVRHDNGCPRWPTQRNQTNRRPSAISAFFVRLQRKADASEKIDGLSQRL